MRSRHFTHPYQRLQIITMIFSIRHRRQRLNLAELDQRGQSKDRQINQRFHLHEILTLVAAGGTTHVYILVRVACHCQPTRRWKSLTNNTTTSCAIHQIKSNYSGDNLNYFVSRCHSLHLLGGGQCVSKSCQVCNARNIRRAGRGRRQDSSETHKLIQRNRNIVFVT